MLLITSLLFLVYNQIRLLECTTAPKCEAEYNGEQIVFVCPMSTTIEVMGDTGSQCSFKLTQRTKVYYRVKKSIRCEHITAFVREGKSEIRATRYKLGK